MALAIGIAVPVSAAAKRDRSRTPPAAAAVQAIPAPVPSVPARTSIKPWKANRGHGQGDTSGQAPPAGGQGKSSVGTGKPSVGNGQGNSHADGKPGRGLRRGRGHHGKPGRGDGGSTGGGEEEPAEPGAGDGEVPVDSTPSPPAVVATTPTAPVVANGSSPTPPSAPAVATPAPAAPATPAPAPLPFSGADPTGAPVRDVAPGDRPAPGQGAPAPSPAGALAGTPFGALAAIASGAPAATSSDDPSGAPRRRAAGRPRAVTRTVVHTVQQAVNVIPAYVWALIAGLGALSLAATGVSSLLARNARRLARQREALLQDVGLLQAALLPEAPAQMPGAAAATAAYRPATSGPPGGDFYDVFKLDGERLGIIVGRVSAKGKRALGVTAHIRHVLRAYLEGGLQPRNALQVGADVLERHLGPDYACATIAVFDRVTSQLTYAGAGMPAPIVLGSTAFEPVTTCAAPPIGMGVATGTRQTTVALPAGATACLYTDGLVDGRFEGGRYGYRRAWQAVEGLEDRDGAQALLDRVAEEADTSVDDTAAVLLRVNAEVGAPLNGERRLEELELGRRELDGERPVLFLRDCGVPTAVIPEMVEDLRETATRLGGAVLRVRFGPGVPEAEAGLRTMEILSAGAGQP